MLLLLCASALSLDASRYETLFDKVGIQKIGDTELKGLRGRESPFVVLSYREKSDCHMGLFSYCRFVGAYSNSSSLSTFAFFAHSRKDGTPQCQLFYYPNGVTDPISIEGKVNFPTLVTFFQEKIGVELQRSPLSRSKALYKEFKEKVLSHSPSSGYQDQAMEK